MKRSLFGINTWRFLASLYREGCFKKSGNRTLGIKIRFYASFAAIILLCCIAGSTFGQQVLVSDVQKKKLADLSVQLNNRYRSNYQRALALAKIHGWPVVRKTKDGGTMSLQGVDALGYPVYLVTYQNIIAAATTGTNTVQPGGSLGLNLSGSSPGLADKLAIWDEGSVYTGHQEFAGKTITLHNGAIPPSDHATHVAGTMIAKGIYPPAKGMAFNATTLHSYDYNNDVPAISAAAPGLLLSNHSYGTQAGWFLNQALNHWEWYGLPGDAVDYKFGFYSQKTQAYDDIAFNAPYYLIVEAAGNIHSATGPPVGADYWGFNSSTDPTLVDKGPRPATISNDDAYDVISETGNAKNILTVGAVNPLPNGPTSSSDIVVGSFSSWGPTDDGRVKPDIVGDGVNVLSTGSANPTAYLTLTGTSMAAPNVTGSLYLLQEYYAQKNGGKFMRAATLKGLACHTAFDAGNPGPDYIYGWGLLDMKRAAQTITDNGHRSIVRENTLNQGQQQPVVVIASGRGPLSATISWTDPAGTPTPDGTINSRTPKLVNDLDIRISDGTNMFYPWILDPSNPSAAAKTGDNILDNVEQVLIPGPQVGVTYTITVSHKGTLQSGSQNYSLIVTGISDSAHCASGALSSADSRIDNVTLSNVNNTPPPGCTAYSSYTNLKIQLAQGVTYPLSVTLGTCGGNFFKAAKVYIDWNADGIFETNELVATTGIMSVNGTYMTNIVVPASVVAGKSSLMRVVLTETTDTSTIKPCGYYAKGETQDYGVQFTIDSSKFPRIKTGILSGSISACVGTPSATPAVQQFTVSGAGLTGNITATAPPGFEVSLAAGGGYGNSVAVVQNGGIATSTIIYVRSAASTPAGSITGNVVLTSPGLNQQVVTVTGRVNALPVINPIPNQGPYLNGLVTKQVNFTGTGLAYNWTNDTPGIGLPATGTDSIPSFTAINKSNKTIKATITVTPVPAPGLAYVANAASNNVSVINTLNDQVVAQIPVGTLPEEVSVSPDGSRVYVTNWESSNISVIDAATNKVINTILTGANPSGIVVSPDNSKLYVCNSYQVSVINTANDAIVSNITISDKYYPQAIAVSPDGGKVYVTTSNDSVKVINTSTNAIMSSIKVGFAPWGIAVTPGGSLVYVANTFDSTISVIDTKTNTVTTTIPVQTGPWGMCFSPDGSLLYVSNSGDNSGPLGPGMLSVISTATNKVITVIPVGQYPIGVSITPDGSKVYVANDFGAGNQNQGTVSVINTATMTITKSINVGVDPLSIGNFISSGTKCTGIPITFTITINSTPSIAVGPVTGTNYACSGLPSAAPNIQQFTVSASDLVQNLTVTAPFDFEVSLTPTGGYGPSVAVVPTPDGTISNTIIYVRLAFSTKTGSMSGNVVLSSTGLTSQNVTVTGNVAASVNPAVSIFASANNVCSGSTVIFTAAPTNGGTAPVYQWSVNGNNVGTSAPTLISSSLVNGDVVSCIMTGNALCTTAATVTSNSITMTVVDLPVNPSVSIVSTSDHICQGTPVSFTATPENAGSAPAYQWLVNSNDAGDNAPVFITSTLHNSDIVSCVMTNTSTCTSSVLSNSITLVVDPLPTVNAGGTKIIAPGDNVQLRATATGPITDITWSPATGLSNNKILDPIATPATTTTYTLTVESADGCVGMDNLTILVRPGTLNIPNAFTPNGDGINDTWAIKYLDLYTNCLVRIYDRAGQNIYSSIGYGKPWDGTYKGSILPTGTYYYIIDLKDKSPMLSGYVAIIR